MLSHPLKAAGQVFLVLQQFLGTSLASSLRFGTLKVRGLNIPSLTWAPILRRPPTSGLLKLGTFLLVDITVELSSCWALLAY